MRASSSPGDDEKPGDNAPFYQYFLIKALGVPWCLGALVAISWQYLPPLNLFIKQN
jgi:hypothetical protein